MNTSNQDIIPHLWFDNQAEEAVSFYTSLFGDSKTGNITHYREAGQEIHQQKPGSVMTVDFELAGQKFIALNGGPYFSFTPAISFLVMCATEEEVNDLWRKLSAGGEILMPLDSYEWSDRYGWTEDRFGLSWQLYRGNVEAVGQKIVPSLMFISETDRAEEAINFYTSLFVKSEVDGVLRYEQGEEQLSGAVKHAQFRLNDKVFMAMDSSPVHNFSFNEAISLLIQCETQDEIDHFWKNLSAVPKAEQCGWLKDKYGVSWQVAPATLPEMLMDSNSEKVERVTNTFMQMKKLNITKLKEAFKGPTINKKRRKSMRKLQFSIDINAPREKVWNTMLDKDSYQQWTEIFAPGSHYEGSWEEGSDIRFLAPNEEGNMGGMVSRIKEN